MRDPNTVYLVGMEPCGSYNGSTTSTMRLLRGNQVLEVDDVLFVETDSDSLEDAWAEHYELAEMEADGIYLTVVNDEQADLLYEGRLALEEGLEN